MPDPAKSQTLWDQLRGLAENLVGEIIDGELVATPKPSPGHSMAASVLGEEILGPFQLGKGGGPGGWWILDEPELHLGEHVLVPDIAGWRKERLPNRPRENWISVPPDWICEVLSPGTVRTDRMRNGNCASSPTSPTRTKSSPWIAAGSSAIVAGACRSTCCWVSYAAFPGECASALVFRIPPTPSLTALVTS